MNTAAPNPETPPQTPVHTWDAKTVMQFKNYLLSRSPEQVLKDAEPARLAMQDGDGVEMINVRLPDDRWSWARGNCMEMAHLVYRPKPNPNAPQPEPVPIRHVEPKPEDLKAEDIAVLLTRAADIDESKHGASRTGAAMREAARRLTEQATKPEPVRVEREPVPQFWMVVNVQQADYDPIYGRRVPSEHSPRFMHDDRISAEREALRLSKEVPNGRFIVLEAILDVSEHKVPRTGMESVYRLEAFRKEVRP